MVRVYGSVETLIEHLFFDEGWSDQGLWMGSCKKWWQDLGFLIFQVPVDDAHSITVPDQSVRSGMMVP